MSVDLFYGFFFFHWVLSVFWIQENGMNTEITT